MRPILLGAIGQNWKLGRVASLYSGLNNTFMVLMDIMNMGEPNNYVSHELTCR